jgi:hypothetical protein
MTILLLALAAPSLAAASPSAVIRDCATDGRLDHKYSDADLRAAEKSLPSDLAEYSDCRDVIAAAITGGPGSSSGPNGRGGGGGPGDHGAGAGPGGGSAAANAAEQAARQQDRAALEALDKGGHAPKLNVGGKTVEPGSNGLFHLASAENSLPLPLLLAMIAVALLAMGGGLYVLRRRVPALARIPLPRIDLSRVRLPRLRR